MRKTRWPPWPLIGWHILDFSETAEWNSTKLDRKQDLNVLYHYQVCVLLADRKNKMAEKFVGREIFRLLLWNHWTEFNKTWWEARSQSLLPSFVFFGPIGKTRCPSPHSRQAPDWLRHVRPLLWNLVTEFNKTWQEERSQCPLPSLHFSARLEKQDACMATPASDWLRHFQLLLWNRWTQFNKSWQDERS